MALLAAPCKSAFSMEEKDAWILKKKSGAVLNAFQKIRKAEASSNNSARLNHLDVQIRTLQAEQDSETK